MLQALGPHRRIEVDIRLRPALSIKGYAKKKPAFGWLFFLSFYKRL
jgi:hypothetical protein